MKKKLVYLIVLILLLVLLLVGINHWFGDNIYAFFKFKDCSVIEISTGEYIVPKDDPDVFREYMKENGWTEDDNLGSVVIFKKGSETETYQISFKYYYAQWDKV